jgi:KEOPS complex subunit Cgi121
MIVVIGTYGTIENIDTFFQQLLTFSKKENLVIQAFNATAIYSKDHLVSATMHAHRAFKQGTNATNTLALEILLYAAGERQIEKAIKKIGIKKGKQKIAFVLTNPLNRIRKHDLDDTIIKKLLQMFHLIADEKVIQGNRATLKLFGITDQELSTVPESHYGELILEKVAMVDVIK